MRIVIASGKGGAGKTTVTACLASQWKGDLMLADADVEAPNLHLLLHPSLAEPETVCLEVPQLLTDKCTGCGACLDRARHSRHEARRQQLKGDHDQDPGRADGARQL